MLLYIFNIHTTIPPFYLNLEIENPKLVSIKVEFFPPSNLNFVKSKDLKWTDKKLPMNNIISVQVLEDF